ncbi:MAG TPA: hypothetical protein VII94_01615, partial [Candidatus Saccharimonadales bacterium]
MKEEKYISGEEFKQLRTKKITNSNGQDNKKILLIIATIVYSVIIFYLGISYQKDHTKTVATTTNKSTTGRFGGFGGGGNFANRLLGTVTAVSSTSISVDDSRTNTTTTVVINSSTQITSNQQAVSASNISVGETVIVGLDSTKNIATTISIINTQASGS